MFKISKNGNIVKEVFITHLPKWQTVNEIRELVFTEYKKAKEVSDAIGGEVVEVFETVEEKQAA